MNDKAQSIVNVGTPGHCDHGASKPAVERLVKLTMPGGLKRLETGQVQCGDDWPGLFIRGDDAAYYSEALDSLMSGSVDPMTLGVLCGLNELLKSSKVGKCYDRACQGKA